MCSGSDDCGGQVQGEACGVRRNQLALEIPCGRINENESGAEKRRQTNALGARLLGHIFFQWIDEFSGLLLGHLQFGTL